MEELDIGLPTCYKSVYKPHQSNNLVITFTPTNGFFLYHNDLNAHKICITTNQPNYYIFNPGSTCKKLAEYIRGLDVKNIILIGSSKAGLASLLWGEYIYRNLPDSYNIFVLSFSPQTLLYPFNERLYFPSYVALNRIIERSDAMKKCAENYGDINKVLADSSLQGMIIYPRLNACDKEEAERVTAKNIKLIGLEYPLHGSFLPFMKQVKDPVKLQNIVKKIYNNAKKDTDISATIPSSEAELLEIVSSINVPTIENLCQDIFIRMNSGKDYQSNQDSFSHMERLSSAKNTVSGKVLIQAYSYIEKINDNSNTDQLIVSLAGREKRDTYLGGTLSKFNYDVLFLRDIKNRWYTDITSESEIIQKIKTIYERKDYKKIVFFGGSAGGYGAFKLASYFNRAKVIAFAPRSFHHPLYTFGPEKDNKTDWKVIDLKDLNLRGIEAQIYSSFNLFDLYSSLSIYKQCNSQSQIIFMNDYNHSVLSNIHKMGLLYKLIDSCFDDKKPLFSLGEVKLNLSYIEEYLTFTKYLLGFDESDNKFELSDSFYDYLMQVFPSNSEIDKYFLMKCVHDEKTLEYFLNKFILMGKYNTDVISFYGILCFQKKNAESFIKITDFIQETLSIKMNMTFLYRNMINILTQLGFNRNHKLFNIIRASMYENGFATESDVFFLIRDSFNKKEIVRFKDYVEFFLSRADKSDWRYNEVLEKQASLMNISKLH